MINSFFSGQRTIFVLAISIAFLLSFVVFCFAENPNWPNAPNEDPRLELPDDPGFEGRWHLLSFIPDHALATIRPEELDLGSGLHADRAWQITTGSADIVIAVLDSGINWDSWELVNKIYINSGEVPVPEGSAVYDANGDGSFDIRDYAGDSRVFDANSNGKIDAGDLIQIFSDQVDDDANGYVDDISGWDFFKHDNDPADDTRYGHGTGEANDAAAQANNSGSRIGVCPDCMVMPVRVSDSFIADSNHFAQGAIFAVDSGAQVILEALGSLNNTPFAQEAILYAVENGVSIAASAADENSFHHNFPAANNRTIHTNNIVPDTDIDITSYMALDSCTNWGPKITVSAPSTHCSSGATGMMGGALGIIYARAHEIALSPPLSSAEVFSIVTTTATDIYNAEAATNFLIYPSLPGWDKFFGHGRIHLRDAVDRVGDNTIPPEVFIDTPAWHSIVSPSGSIPITGYINAPRASSFDYKLEAIAGLTPNDDWILFTEQAALTVAVDGLLGFVDPTQLNADKAIKHDVTDHNAILLRITVTDSLGNEVEYYHSFFVLNDPDWVTGYPVELGSSGEASPVMVDLDGDEVFELIVPESSGLVHAYKNGPVETAGWPTTTGYLQGQDPGLDNYRLSAAYQSGAVDPDRYQAIQLGVAAGDLDGDGSLEIVAGTMDGEVYVWGAGGSIETGFPVALDPTHSQVPEWKIEYGIFAPPVLADIDGDTNHDLEIIVTGMDQWVYAWHHDGTAVSGWPVLCRDPIEDTAARIISSPAIGDIDGDGTVELIVTTNERYNGTGRMYALFADGNDHAGGPYLPGWPVELSSLEDSFLPYIGEGTPTPASLADIDNDGDVEIVINAGISVPMIYDGDGTLIRICSPFIFGFTNGTSEFLMGVMNSYYSIADLSGSGRLSIITGGVGLNYGLQLMFPGYRIPAEFPVGAWYADTGSSLKHWPQITEDLQFANAHAVADIDGDGMPEVITGSGGHYLHAYDYSGNEPPGWPKFTGGWINTTPAVGDMDGDGLLEVAVVTREGTLFAWNTTGPADGNIQWSSLAHDPQNTGNYHTSLPSQQGPDDDDDDDNNDDDNDDNDNDDNDDNNDDDNDDNNDDDNDDNNDDDNTGSNKDGEEAEEDNCCG